MEGSKSEKFTRTARVCECPLCGRRKYMLRRKGHNPKWLFYCGCSGVRLYGDRRCDVYKWLQVTRRAMAERGQEVG